jgi:hypothetical protein
MALSEDGQLAAAAAEDRAIRGERTPTTPMGTHRSRMFCYESGEPDPARAYMSSWLAPIRAMDSSMAI